MSRLKKSHDKKRLHEAIPLCRINRHSPDKTQVRWDGTHFISTCTHCGAPIRRRHRDLWRKDWLETIARPSEP